MSAFAMITGHVGKDPETKATPSGQQVTSFSVGVHEGFGDKKTTSWFTVSVWDKLAESVPKYVRKGALVEVMGRIRIRKVTKNGEDRFYTEVTGLSVERLDTRPEPESASPGVRQAAKPAPRQAAAPDARASTSSNTFGDLGIEDDDIPF